MSCLIDRLQVGCDVRTQALQACRAQIGQWGAALPDVDPLVMDFGLGNFARTGSIEFWIANELDAGYCGKYMFVSDGQTCPLHSHRVKHETFFLVKGQLCVRLDGQTLTLDEGQTLTIAPGRIHDFTGVGPSLMLELSMPCDVHDNQFEDARVMQWLTTVLEQTDCAQ